ncbi:Cytochrome p450 1a2 [Apiospora hydei]|uniref:Cytochrome p450 1a2 n=1 Tax=Apiospora hydei TaxID=1337664 RepID=A0ABR1VI20_9PEZI
MARSKSSLTSPRTGSDVIYVNMLGQHIVVLNSAVAATELLDQRGANYCDRPDFTLFEIMGWGRTLTFLKWGEQFKLHRKMFQSTFSRSNIGIFRPMQLQESRKAVRSLIKGPGSWRESTLLMTTSIIFRIAFGQEVPSESSPYCEMTKAASQATAAGGIAGTSLVDIFPPIQFVPGWINPSAVLRHARVSRNAIQAVHDQPWETNMRAIEAGTAPSSFMKIHWDRFVESAKAGRPQEASLADIKGATGATIIAGGNTTWATILSCMLFLTRHPEAQRVIQARLDMILYPEGQARLPGFGDRCELKCLDDFIMETMRCLPLNPLNIPHKSLRDDVYRGMFIPAGTMVLTNTTALATDAGTYKNPHVFDPARYERGEPYPLGNFGFGRRKCPGNWLALASVYMFLATFLAVFELEQALDDEGKPKIPEPGVSVGLGGHPLPFECVLKVRSQEMARLLMEDA